MARHCACLGHEGRFVVVINASTPANYNVDDSDDRVYLDVLLLFKHLDVLFI